MIEFRNRTTHYPDPCIWSCKTFRTGLPMHWSQDACIESQISLGFGWHSAPIDWSELPNNIHFLVGISSRVISVPSCLIRSECQYNPWGSASSVSFLGHLDLHYMGPWILVKNVLNILSSTITFEIRYRVEIKFDNVCRSLRDPRNCEKFVNDSFLLYSRRFFLRSLMLF